MTDKEILEALKETVNNLKKTDEVKHYKNSFRTLYETLPEEHKRVVDSLISGAKGTADKVVDYGNKIKSSKTYSDLGKAFNAIKEFYKSQGGYKAINFARENAGKLLGSAAGGVAGGFVGKKVYRNFFKPKPVSLLDKTKGFISKNKVGLGISGAIGLGSVLVLPKLLGRKGETNDS